MFIPISPFVAYTLALSYLIRAIAPIYEATR